jgi:alkylhydroperoxidase/carboxymuconolactone decarboxylase family protein YurZ
MIAVAAAVESEMRTTTFMKGAKIAGVSKEEIAGALMVTLQAKGATTFATAVEGLEQMLGDCFESGQKVVPTRSINATR